MGKDLQSLLAAIKKQCLSASGQLFQYSDIMKTLSYIVNVVNRSNLQLNRGCQVLFILLCMDLVGVCMYILHVIQIIHTYFSDQLFIYYCVRYRS